jgi:hypothetical protein
MELITNQLPGWPNGSEKDALYAMFAVGRERARQKLTGEPE